MIDHAISGSPPATLSCELAADWFNNVAIIAGENGLRDFLRDAGIPSEILERPGSRITDDQAIKFYQVAAKGTRDEMMGLWSRPIRSGALKYICLSIVSAPTPTTALNRLTQIWNLFLDDYYLELEAAEGNVIILLCPRTQGITVNRFGHVLMLKLVHGIISWLAGREIPVTRLSLAFRQPAFGNDYSLMFQMQPQFSASRSAIGFASADLKFPMLRTEGEVRTFLERAPRDWMFTTSTEHALALRVRHVLALLGLNISIDQAAGRLAMSVRTLTRKLANEGESFQRIKERLRRDMAMRALANTDEKIEVIAIYLGYAAAPIFHRAFKATTGMTPTQYRRVAGSLESV